MTMSHKGPTLLILAAGLGSRYGGLKQIEPVGPHGERIIDYCIHDAVRAGFGRVVFVIRSQFESAFRDDVIQCWEPYIQTAYEFQELDTCLPGPVPKDREKPWGTGHAVLAARDTIDGPFAVINADDYYGPRAFVRLHDYLMTDTRPDEHALIAYTLGQTLSEAGTVSRGVCHTDPQGRLTSITECTEIQQHPDDTITGKDPEGHRRAFSGTEPVSMNCWGFKPEFWSLLQKQWERFLEAGPGPKQEFYLPAAVNNLLKQGALSVKVLETREKWFGVTYQADRDGARGYIRQLIENGVYPERL